MNKEEKNKAGWVEFMSKRKEWNKIVESTELVFDEKAPLTDLYVVIQYKGGKIETLSVDGSKSLDKLISSFKRPGQSLEEKDDRIRKMGIQIAELNRKLKDK